MHQNWLTIALLAGAAGCRPSSDDVPAAVFVLVLDGVRTQESFGDAPSDAAGTDHPSELMPETWDRLVPKGVRAANALNIGSTITAPAHAAIASGRRLPFGNYELENEDPGLYRPELPSLMEALRGQLGLSSEQVEVTGNTVLVKPMSYSLWPADGYDHRAGFGMVYEQGAEGPQPAQNDMVVIRDLKERIQLAQPRFVLANLHQVDRAGHYGDAPDYARRIGDLDAELAGFWGWLQEQPAYAGDTWLFVVGDHGRHTDAGGSFPWSGHGDECWGCRNVPLLVLGPNVRAGQVVETPVLLTDLAPTIAALLDIELPWADGRVVDELFTAPLDRGDRGGVAAIAVAGGRTAEVRYLGRADRRKELVVDGERLSSDDAFSVDAPAMASDGERDWLCFRELTLALGGDMPWVPRCFVDRGEGWSALRPPQDEVGPFWEPTLLADGEGLLLLSPFNPFGVASFGTGQNTVGVRASRYGNDQWRKETLTADFSFPGVVAALVDRRRVLHAAFSGALGGVTARDERRLWTGAIADRSEWGPPDHLDADPAIGDVLRMERPALGLGSDGALRMASLAHTEALTRVAIHERSGEGWSLVGLLASESAVMPHLAPMWRGDEVVFVALNKATARAEVCRGAWDAAVTCEDVGPQRVLDAALDGDTLHLLVDQGVGSWERVEVSLE